MPLQNLAEGSNLWCAAFGRHYSAHVDATELTAMTRAFQQRHLLAHTQDLVDQDYIARSGDTAYRPGQHRRRRPGDATASSLARSLSTPTARSA